MIRALLGYQLISISDEDLVVSIREDAFIYSIESLKSEGWSILEAIYCSDLDTPINYAFLVYRLRSEWRSHKTLAVQVRIDHEQYWHSVSELFPNGKLLEDILTNEDKIRFK